MGILDYIFGALLFSQPVQQGASFLLALIVLLAVRRRWKWNLIPLAIGWSSAFMFIVAVVLAGVWKFFPLWIVTEIVLAGFGFLAYKADARLHWRSLPLASMIYFFAFNQFTFVRKTMVKEVEWSIHTFPEGPRAVHLYLGADKVLYWRVHQEKLADYLEKRNLPSASIQMDLLYQWGRLSGTSLDFVAGQNMTAVEELSFECEGDCLNMEPFPRYYWGLRGLR